MTLTLASELRRLDEPRYRADFYRAWHVGYSAGLTHSATLGALAPSPSASVELLRRGIVDATAAGRSVVAALSGLPGALATFESALLAASEASGTLESALRLLADHFTFEYKRTLRVRILMGYPIFLWVVASFAVPIVGLHVQGWQRYLATVGLWLAALFLVGGVPIRAIAGMLLESPQRVGVRVARVLAMLLAAGAPRARAVRAAVDASGSADLKRHFTKRSERDLNTIPLATLFEGSRAIPAELLSQLRIADVTHDYQDTLGRYADTAERDAR